MRCYTKKWKYSTESPTYNSWRSMRNRVLYNSTKDHDFYKTKGIKICDRWIENFDNFYEDMGERPFGTSLDRIDGNGDYEPSNCRWASARVQQNNKDNLTKIEHNGVIKTIGEWAFELEIPDNKISTLYKRHTKYGANTYEEIFADHLMKYRTSQRINKCLVCGREETIKWRRDGKMCNTCYHRGLRWSKRTGNDINTFPEWADICGYSQLVVDRLNGNTR